MVKGQRVVCINDSFADFVKAIYAALPVKGKTYTIRDVGSPLVPWEQAKKQLGLD